MEVLFWAMFYIGLGLLIANVVLSVIRKRRMRNETKKAKQENRPSDH